MSVSFLNKRIPTILGLLLLTIAVLATSYLVNTGVILFGGAAPTDNPEDVRITNVSDTTFTITYKTEAQVIGTITLQDNGKSDVILDERDQTGGVPKMYKLHSISVKNAKPNTPYTFSITSGATVYQNNNTPYTVQTAENPIASPSATAPLTGKVVSSDGTAPQEALIFTTTQGGQTLSTLTQPNGVYILPLNAMRTNDFTNPLLLTPTTLMQVLAEDDSSVSQIQVPLSGANPVPLVTLGSNYNFVASTNPIASTAASLGFPTFPQTNLSASPVIITPKKDQGFTDTQPQFQGTALPNENVQIEIHSTDVITTTVTTDASGHWTYRPTTPLSPGNHTLTITAKNAAGILQTIQESFTVYASGSQVNQSATPSGQLSPTVSPTTAPTNAPQTLSPTTTVSLTPVISPTKVVTPKPTLPATGSDTLVTSSIFALAAALIGGVVFVLARGASL